MEVENINVNFTKDGLGEIIFALGPEVTDRRNGALDTASFSSSGYFSSSHIKKKMRFK